MRRLITATTLAWLALAVSLVNSHAAQQARGCPTIRISCPDIFRVGSDVSFTAVVSDLVSDSKLTYNWTVSAGAIVTGQGTNSIVVDTAGLKGEPLTGTVEVGGLPGGCSKSASCSIFDYMPRISDCCKIDEYGSIRFSDEKARLDSFAVELSNEPTARGYLVCYGGRRGCRGEAQRRCARARSYLVNTGGFDASRVVAVAGSYRDDLTVELYLIPTGTRPPSPSSTVEASEVRFIRCGSKGKARRR